MTPGGPEARFIGPYEVRGRLGAGGMGEVFLAWDERLGRHVAIKRIRADVDPSADRRRRFRREARAAATLSHPAIVQVHDILEDASGDAVVMEYVEGRSLAEWIGGGGLDAAAVVEAARQVAEGLARAHHSGIVHRDLKAANVMLTEDGRAKILDFGLARILAAGDSLSQSGALLGTVSSMSPEQASGGEVDARSDLFALGVLLYEMLAGRSPFRGEHVGETLQNVLTATVPPLSALRPEVPPQLSALVARLLEKDPRNRPRSAAEVGRELAEIASLPALAGLGPPSTAVESVASDVATVSAAGTRPTAAAPGAPTERFVRRAVLPAAALVVAAAMAAGVWLLAGRPTQRDPAPGAAIRVAVIVPEAATGDDPRLDLAVFAARQALLGGLAAAGLEPVDPAEIGGEVGSLDELARRSAAAEAVSVEVVRYGEMGSFALRRLRLPDGEVVAGTAAFQSPIDPEYFQQLAAGLRRRLAELYPEVAPAPRTPATESPATEIPSADFADFLVLQKRSLAGGGLDAAAIDELEAIAERSPGFLEALLLAADQARVAGQLERAGRLVDTARERAPRDPRPLTVGLRVELAAGRPDAAEAMADELERLAPGDLRVLGARARIAEHRGDLRRASGFWSDVVELRPTWRNLHQLTRIELRLGEHQSARSHLVRLLEMAPDNTYVLGQWAAMELLYGGDLEKAEDLFRRLVRIDRRSSHLGNLGQTLYLRGRYEQAAEAYREALDLAPGGTVQRLNLADALLAGGRTDAALALYRELAEELEGTMAERALGAVDGMILALCRARAGEREGAVELVQKTVERFPEDADVTYLAALVYELVGDGVSARVNARRALDAGYHRGWFETPDFVELPSPP